MASFPTKVCISQIKRPLMLGAALVIPIILVVVVWLLMGGFDAGQVAAAAGGKQKLEDIPFNGSRAYEMLRQLCAIGPRPSGSPGMEAQQKLLIDHFQKLGGQIELQRFRIKHPHEDGDVHMVNILARWQPEKKDRILLCAHYDTLPYPMRDHENPQGRFEGANDNASGVAVLMEMAHDISSMQCKYGIDLLMLDGEEFRFTEQDPFFIGSQYFAEQYAKGWPRCHYRWGVLLDMVGDSDLQLFQERNSLDWRDTHGLTENIWLIAAKLGVREFIRKPKHEVSDDHVILHEVGKIPCIDIIDFDYAPWHTQADLPNQCSPLSLAKVGWVLEEWLKTVR